MFMNQTLRKALRFNLLRQYHFAPPGLSMVGENPGLTAKRIIDCVGRRLREIDPIRYSTMPITFKTHFRDAAGYVDLWTAMNIHDALEEEFGIEIRDRQTLISDIETAFIIVNEHEDSN